MDPLSDLLRVVRLDGAFFYAVEASEPWSTEALPSRALAPRIMPEADHLIPYHVLTKGCCWAGLIGEEQVEMRAGDVVVFPHGDAHVMSSRRGVRLRGDTQRPPSPYPFLASMGDEGPPVTSLICGFLACDRRPFNPLLATLPRLMHLEGASSPWLVGLVRELAEEARLGRPGVSSVITRLAEVLFIQSVRRHLERLPQDKTGWLAGLSDPLVGKALALLHSRSAHAWTLAELAKETNSSRSSLTKRFTELVGQPPMQYLAEWRMHVAASLLAQTAAKVASIGLRVGYESESAFSRAFKKSTGLSPRAWREARRLPAA